LPDPPKIPQSKAPALPAKKASAEPPETDAAPVRPSPPARLTYDTPEETARVRAQYEQDQAAFTRDYPAWRSRYLERVAKARAARQAEEREAANARQAKDQEAARALAERLAKDREAEQERQIEASTARAVRAVAEKLLGQEPTAPAQAQRTPPVGGGRSPHPDRDALVDEYEKRLARGESQRHAASMTARQAKPKVHRDTIRRWHREK
jgi:hypothetical protein